MKISSIIAAALAAAASKFSSALAQVARPQFHHATQSTRRSARNTKAGHVEYGCPQSDKDDNLPRGYPGAKLARKAFMKQLAVKHPRGLRANGVTI